MRYFRLVLILVFFCVAPMTYAQQTETPLAVWPSVAAEMSREELTLFRHLQRLNFTARTKAERAQPVHLPGVKNMYQVSAQLYRGSQPTREGYQALANMGIKTVVSLRRANPNPKLTQDLPLTVKHIPMNPFIFKDTHAREFLAIVSDPKNQPVYVHCLYGSDRTGAMVALYRMALQRWSAKAAIEEMKNGGFGFHMVFANLITYLKEVNLADIFPPAKKTFFRQAPKRK